MTSLRQQFHELVLPTSGRSLIDFTASVKEWVATNKFRDGLVTLHLRHTSASLLIQENADPDVQHDLESFFARIVRDGDPVFRHVAEGSDDMPAHIRTAITAVNLSIPLHDGRLVLGTWQGIYLWEHRTHPHTRHIVLHFIGDCF